MTPGPGSRKCTAYLRLGPGGMRLALRLTEWLACGGRYSERFEGMFLLYEDRAYAARGNRGSGYSASRADGPAARSTAAKRPGEHFARRSTPARSANNQLA